MSKTAKITGVEREVSSIDYIVPKTLDQKYELKSYIEVSSTRSENQVNTVSFDEHDIVALQFTDDTEWIGHPEDVQDIYGKKVLAKRSLSNDDYVFDIQILSENENRGIIKRAMVKVFSVFKPKVTKKDIAKLGIKELAKAYDKRVQSHPGLYQIDAKFTRVENTNSFDNAQPVLLMLHGTLSNTIDAFHKLNENNEAWNDIVSIYDNQILALEHYTLSVSPLQNALDFLKDCPKECILDILSHSRGGLVADILAKCDRRNPIIGFSKTEIGILDGNDNEEDNQELMNAINEMAKKKKITVNKVVRVAAPASGTTILSRRVDHFFNLFLNAVVLAFGAGNPIYHAVKAFLLELVSQKENPEVLPGLNAMMPESLFQKMMNASDTSVVSDLYNISGDADVGGINFNSLKVILANLFYRVDNDLVVDTHRMEHGIKRKEGIYKFLAKGGTTNHFNYFSADNSSIAIVEALNANANNPTTLFKKHIYTEGERGILLDPLSMEGFQKKPETITKDIVIIVPGIMGSTIANNNEEQWVDMPELNRGAIVKKLGINAKKVAASGIIKKYYYGLADHLSEKYDVVTFQFDWRKSVKGAAEELKNQLEDYLQTSSAKIHIVAHSMGGLVVRQCMMDYEDTWSKFKENVHNRFIMLGTPWLGSYLIMEVLTGHSKRVKQLAFIDFKHNRKELLEVFWKYPGVFELLPIEDDDTQRPFWQQTFWKNLDVKTDLKHMPDPKDNAQALKDFKTYRDNIQTFLNSKLDNDDFRNIYYICGQSDQTVFDYEFKDRWLSKNDKLVYKATSHGDGSVTWKTGIPKQLLNTPNLYYTHTSHGDLANEDYIFHGISDILETGATNRLNNQQPASRSGEIISEVFESPEPLYDSKAVVDALFGTHKTIEPEAEFFNVKIIHGDLKMSSYPVMVGHFFMDLILSSEKALDSYLDNRLSQRLSIGYYPGEIGESEVFFNLKTKPKGAIVCGLGSTGSLTSYVLSKTVKQAVLKYAMFMRDNYTLPSAKKYATGISFVLMGIGYGKLPIEDSLKGILLGVAEANKQIKETGEGLKLIKDIEIVNYYESVASEAYFSLTRLYRTDNRVTFNYEKGIARRPGAKKKKIFANYSYDWWFNLHINSVKVTDESKKDDETVSGFRYFASNGLARVEQEMVGIGLNKINHLLTEMSVSSNWDERLSKSLFEMLIPNDFKNTFRNQNNLVLKLDKSAAQIPWELLHDNTTTEIPASVTSSFIRQLISEDTTRFNQVGFQNKEAFVVGDPVYDQEGLSPLPAAKAEAEWVSSKLTKEGYKVNSLLHSNAKNIMMELFSKHYMMMHFAGHGIYDPENNNIGIAIGSGICIDPAMINQLGYVPEFVFINCCFSGVVNAKDDKYSQNRYRLAANIGTQLIEMGVKAIVIAGWAVDDSAAKVFSETFYERMLQGYDFGSAVQFARLECYQQHKHSNTWGAYQCYGNQFYKFNDRQKLDRNNQEYVVSSQVHTDLDNLLISIRDKKEKEKSALAKLDTYIDRAEASNLLDAMVLEKEALIYDELGNIEVAFQKYKGLFQFDNGNFSIKALEQYCLVQSYRLEASVEAAKKSKKKDAVGSVIAEYLNEIRLLTLAGRNASRLNIVGNAYKLTAKHLGEKEEIEQLKTAYSYYNEAMEMASDKYSGQYLDALSNILMVGHILETLGDKKLIDRLKTNKVFEDVTDLVKHLTDYRQELDDFDKADLDISVLIGMTEISYAILLISNTNDTHHDQKILGWYNEIFNQIYSPRYIKIEMLQIDFLRHYVKDAELLECLDAIKIELENLLNN
ncbi:DUF7379 domain-containing protein [Winogradskyella forsetii]|uniref:DUF7379 domain-containing protein n=1 Tax=Winogradskyella forsetii TaxID=2686077 RepID=UPI0015BF2C26|nr:CHAT domain-containing protein [Winogradskyella forsetii]